MKIMPFLAVSYVIAGLANLGLPGLSGFIAEMTIFNGAFQHPDTFHRVWTVIACTSIVITAVYILRLVGKILYGTCTDKHHLTLSDATLGRAYRCNHPHRLRSRTRSCPAVDEQHDWRQRAADSQQFSDEVMKCRIMNHQLPIANY